jgi:hypothetical protein
LAQQREAILKSQAVAIEISEEYKNLVIKHKKQLEKALNEKLEEEE